MDTRELELIALNQLLARNRVFGSSIPMTSVQSLVKDLSTGLALNPSDSDDTDVVNVTIENHNNCEETSTVERDEHEHEEHLHTPSPSIEPKEEELQEASAEPNESKTIGGKLFQYFRGDNGPK